MEFKKSFAVQFMNGSWGFISVRFLTASLEKHSTRNYMILCKSLRVVFHETPLKNRYFSHQTPKNSKESKITEPLFKSAQNQSELTTKIRTDKKNR